MNPATKANNPQMNREWTLEIEPGSLGNNSYSIRAYSKNEIVTEYSNAYCTAELEN